MKRNKMKIYLSHKRQHMTGDISLCKSGPGISKEIFPLPLERYIVGRITQRGVILGYNVLLEVALESSTPCT